jgi:hypothetical protein
MMRCCLLKPSASAKHVLSARYRSSFSLSCSFSFSRYRSPLSRESV